MGEVDLKPKVRDDLAVVDVDGESVVYDAREDGLYHLNQAGAIALKVCDGTGTVEEVALDIAEVSGQPQDQVLEEFRHAVHHFGELGLLEGSVAAWNREGERPTDDTRTPTDDTPIDRDHFEEPETQNH